MAFGAPGLLAALIAAPIALALGWLLWRRRRLHLLALRELGGGAITRTAARRGHGRRTLLLAAVLAMLAVAAARPQFGSNESTLEQSPPGVVFALDVSLSMSADDLQPSRFAAAAAEVRRLIDAQRTTGVGLVIFAGEPFVRFPLTLDHASALAVLDALQPGESLVPPGSNIAAAIETALDLLLRAESVAGAIVVVSDGETHEGAAAAAARAAREAGTRVFAAGVGSEVGARVPAPGGRQGEHRIDARTGREVISRIQERPLQAIAAAGGGRYLRINAPGALSSLSADFAAIERSVGEGEHSAAQREQFQWFAGAALALLVGGSLARAAWMPGFGRRARRILALAALAALALVALTACAGSRAERINREGNAHFAAGRYRDALEAYREAQRRAPQEAAIALNTGRALHALGEFERAEAATLSAMRSDDPAVRAMALFHAGNHRWAADDLLGARAAYIEALRSQPDLLDAKINLELINRLLAEEASEIEPQASVEGPHGGEEGSDGESTPAESEAGEESGELGGESGRAESGDGTAAEGDGAAAQRGTPTFEENDRVAQRDAADEALQRALDALPLEDASAEQAMVVLDALRAAPDQRFASEQYQASLEGVDDW